MNLLDQAIAYVAPQVAAKRARARLQMTAARRYEGAIAGRRTQNWFAPDTSANAEIWKDAAKLRQRMRDLVRNNPWAARAVQTITANTVGTGIMPRINVPAQSRQRRMRELWRQWAETTQCDADGRHDIYGLQSLALRAVVESGEVLIRRRFRRPEDGLALPLQLQVLEADYLDNQHDIERNEFGGPTIQGVEFDAIGRRRGYWLYRGHPLDRLMTQLESVRVPASDVIHVYRQDRPGQVRGVPWGAPVILSLRDLDGYEDAYLLRQKLANCFTAFIYESDPTGIDSNKDLTETLEPGAIEILPPGKDVRFADPPKTDGYGEYTKAALKRIAAGFGVTYETLTGDMSDVNFSSGRMGWIEMQRNIESWRWQMLIPQMCSTVGQWFTESVDQTQPGLANGAMWEWTAPRREMIDPTKEVPAMRDRIRAGLASLPEVIRENGYDPETLMAEIAESNKLLDQLGIVLDSDPRQTSAQGQAQQEVPSNEAET